MHYILKNDDGAILDASGDDSPCLYIQGKGNIIPGLEKQLEDLEPGARVDVIVSPAEAYGERNEEYLDTVPLSGFPEPDQVAAGAQFHASTGQGTRICTVVKVEREEVTVDFNHPLAGQTLHFDVKIEDVRVATAEELAHGHVHGPDCRHTN
jgi:FKBP-type peptidyl-prolyl cis-trans isomerase SlyD